MGNRIPFDEISQQLCSIYRVTLCSFQNEFQNASPYLVRCGQLESVIGYLCKETTDGFKRFKSVPSSFFSGSLFQKVLKNSMASKRLDFPLAFAPSTTANRNSFTPSGMVTTLLFVSSEYASKLSSASSLKDLKFFILISCSIVNIFSANIIN